MAANRDEHLSPGNLSLLNLKTFEKIRSVSHEVIQRTAAIIVCGNTSF